MKKIITTLLSIVVCLGLCVGCVPTKPPENLDTYMQSVVSKIDFSADENYTGKLVIACNEEPSELTIINTFINKFKQKYPKIEVKLEKFASNSYFQSLKSLNSTAIQTNNYDNMPDIFWMSTTEIPEFDSLELVMPINYINAKDDGFSTDKLLKTMVDTSTFNENLYMMPRDYNQVTMYINEAIFEQAGVALPPMDRPMTKAELYAMCEKLKGLKTAGGNTIYPLDITWNWDPIMWPVLKGNGGEVIKLEGNKAVSAIDSTQTYETYKEIKEMQINGYLSQAGKGATETFVIGQAAMTMHSRPTMPDMLSKGYVKKLNAIPVPQFAEDYYVGAGCSGYGMYKHANNLTESWLFLKSVVTEEFQNAFCETGSGIPVLKDLLTAENAAYKNYTADGMVASFNHNAFIYGNDTSAVCTSDDYKKLLPYKAISAVDKAFKDSILNCLIGTNASNYTSPKTGIPKFIKASDTLIKKELAKI